MTSAVDPAPTFRQAAEHLDVDAQVLVTTGAGAHLLLDGTAATLWQLLAEARSLDELAIACAEHYEGDQERIRADVVATIEDWQRRGIVEER